MSQVHGVLAARDLLIAAGMDDQVVQVLTEYKMWDELVAFSREHKANLLGVLQKVAEIKREQGDQRGCAQLESELCVELFKQGASEGRLVHALQSATRIQCELGMFEEAVQLCKRCGNTEILVQVVIAWLTAQPNQFQNIAQQLARMQKLEQTIQGALDKKMFDVSMQLAEYCEDPDQMKKDIWYRQGKIFQAELKYQEAEHAFMTAGKPMDALQMYISCKKWADAEKVVNNMPMGDNKDKAVKMIKLGRAQAMVQEGRYKEAETIYAEMGDIETMVTLYKEKQMYQEAMQFAKAHDRRDLINEVQ